ncbi:MAG TPA: lipoprotein-releasing ABC transporter permease subunit [Steroidobacteraceae bacterium]|nr:lipoprotein-releasing ABC transporter permease subunit [Steroidobacteraceae bacterium]
MMFSSYEWHVGSRYLSSGHRNRFISFISLISIVGLTLGVVVLIIVLSVMNGFEHELRNRILSMTPHATIMGLNGRLAPWQEIQRRVEQMPEVTAAAPYIEDQGMLVNGSHVSGALVRGIEPAQERRVGSLGARLTAGSMEDLLPGSYHIILGAALARELDVKVGSSVIVVVAQGNATPIGVVPRLKRFTVSGIFSAGMYEFDRGLALVSMQDAARLYRLGDAVTGVRLSLRDLFRAPTVVQDVALALGGGFFVSDWTRKHANFFRSIEITKGILFVILLLIIGVAAFNLVSTLVMVVKEKQSDIAILRTIGSTPRSILGIFIVQGAIIGLFGTALGVLFGVLISINLEGLVHVLERVLNTHFLDPSVYFMSDLPALVETGDVVRIAGTAFVLCCLSTLYPAWRAARTQPAEALRHE